MPIKCRFEEAAGLVVFVHRGVVPDKEFLSTYRVCHQDPRFKKTFHVLVDLREAKSGVRSPEALRSIAEFRRQWLDNPDVAPKVAIVAPADISYGLARMYEAYSDAMPFHFVVFRAVEAALAWLGVPEDLLEGGESTPG